MALTLSKTGITDGQTIQVGHVTQSVDAFTKVTAYDISLSGSLTLTGSLNSFNGFTGSFTGSHFGTANLSGSFTGSFTGSHFGTANLSGSFTGSYLGTANLTGSFTGSYRGTANLSGSFTGSYLGDANLTGSFTGSFTGSLRGDITGQAQTLSTSFYPNGTGPNIQPAKIIAGTARLNGGSPATITLGNFSELAGKGLGTNCFVTATLSGSAPYTGTVNIGSLSGTGALTFTGNNGNADLFFFQVIYY
jgi:hypothetical protein